MRARGDQPDVNRRDSTVTAAKTLNSALQGSSWGAGHLALTPQTGDVHIVLPHQRVGGRIDNTLPAVEGTEATSNHSPEATGVRSSAPSRRLLAVPMPTTYEKLNVQRDGGRRAACEATASMTARENPSRGSAFPLLLHGGRAAPHHAPRG